MATYTANYQLHQWVPEDNFLRTDFNQDFQKLDTALAEVQALAGQKSRVVAGTYTGNAAENRQINLGFQPIAVLVEISFGKRAGSGYSMFGGLAVRGGSLQHSDTALSITQTGFQVDAGGGEFHQHKWAELPVYRHTGGGIKLHAPCRTAARGKTSSA